MVELNLIPWRSRQLIYDKKQQRIVVMVAVLLAVSVWAMLHVYLQKQLDNEREQLKILQANLTRLTASHTKKTVAIESGFTPHQLALFMNRLTVAAESGVCYQQIAYENHELSLTGQSWSVASLLANLGNIEVPEQFNHYQVNKLERKGRFTALDYNVKYKERARDQED